MIKLLRISFVIIFVLALFVPKIDASANAFVPLYFHKQMDYEEYEGYFLPKITNYFGSNDVRLNFCGTATLLNVLDIMMFRNNQQVSGYNFVDIVNKYYVDDYGMLINTYKHGDLAVNPNGSMNFTAMYWLADKIGKDTGLWKTVVVHGTNDSTYHEPIKKSELHTWVELMQKDVFEKGGVAVADIARSKDGEHTAYLHFILILDAATNPDGSAQLLIMDSMGTEHNGFYGWVNSSEYTAYYGMNEYTGIMNIYGIIPVANFGKLNIL